MRISALLLLACFIALDSWGQTEIAIQSRGNGTLTWTNDTTAVRYRVEWSHVPEGPWYYSWDSLSDISSGTNYVLTAYIPVYYRVIMLPGSDHPVITASPSNIVTYNGGKTVLTVTGGTPPYTWYVDDYALGSVNPSSGYATVYTRAYRYDNVVKVYDSMGDYALIVIQQP